MIGIMKTMKEIKHEDKVVCRLFSMNELEKGLTFFSDDSEFLQVGTWNYDNGVSLQRHIHNILPRTINRTNELIVVMNGRLKLDLYSLKKEFISSFELTTNDVAILMDCGHGYEILEENTKVLEVKNGPYFGPELDRERF